MKSLSGGDVRRKVGAGVVICGDEEGTRINLQHPYVEFKEIVVKVCGEKVGSVILVATTFCLVVVLLSLIEYLGDSLVGFTKLEWFNKAGAKLAISNLVLCV